MRIRCRDVSVVLMLCVCMLTSQALAQPVTDGNTSASPKTERVQLSELIEEALQKSPGLQAKKRAYDAARATVLAAALPDDPMVGVDVEGQSKLLRLTPRTDNEYMVSQTIPFPTTLWLRAQLAAREANMAFHAYKEEERQIIWHIEQPYYELRLARQVVGALDQIHALAQRLVTAARARYEANQGSQQDLLKAQIELSKVEIELFNWQAKVHLAEAHFSHILTRPLDTHYDIAEPSSSRAHLVTTQAELERLAVASRPELKALEAGIRRAKTHRWLALTNWLPDITGRIEARQFRGEDGVREKDTFIGVTVPVWSLLKDISGEWTSSARDVQAAEALYEEMKNEVWLAIHEAYAKVEAAEYALRRYETAILPNAKQQVEVALAAYQAGTADFLTLIDAQRTLKETQIAYYQMVADHELGLSNVRVAVGTELAAGDKTEGQRGNP